jgi:sugar-specific transcriptional regulator TrmB
MEINEVLEKIGLNEKEASVYLAVLELGTASVMSIAQKAGLKRPTTYLVLDDLQAKGLVGEVPQSKKTLYTAQTPENLLNDLRRKQELVTRALPELLAIHNQKQEKPQVQLFRGTEGLRQVYEKMFSAKQVSFFCTLQEAGKAFPDVPKRFKQLAQEKKIVMREIVTQSSVDIAHARWVENAYEIRTIPKESEFLTDNALFDDSVAFLSFEPYPFVVLITSKGIVTSLKTLFELAWQSATPFKN